MMRHEVEMASGGDKQTVVVAVESASGGSDGSGKAVAASVGEEGKAKGGCLEVDLESGGGDWESDGERLCRICHLCAELVGSAAEGWELIEIGCGCKGELGIAHRRCSEAWFRVKGNRLCEICGMNAKNILGKDDSNFMEVWHEGGRRLGANNNRSASNRDSYWTRQKFCSFLISFLAIAFILQWYFRASFS